MDVKTTEGENGNVIVSVVIPVLNEEKYISGCIESILKQDYPHEQIEFIFVDGGSSDATIDIINDCIGEHPDIIRLERNPKRTAPCAMNVGIRAARGEYIVRLDAHSIFPKDYVSNSIRYLELTGADVVGGFLKTESSTFVGEIMAAMASSPFGVGRSRYRVGGKDGFVDAVPFGAFRKDLVNKIGFFNENLDRCEDGEFDYRVRKNGGKLYLTNDIHFTYYCRDRVGPMMNMAFQNGLWNVVATYLCPGSMNLRHFVPLGFVVSLATLPALAWGYDLVALKAFFEAITSLYLLLDIFFSAKSSRGKGLRHMALLLVLFPMFHISFGAGSIAGIFRVLVDRKNLSEVKLE